MNRMSTPFLRRRAALAASVVALALGCTVAAPALANEAVIRKAIQERMPRLQIDEIRTTPVAGIWEVRYGGSEILYSDARGEYLFVGASMIEMRTRNNLTEDRLEELLSVPWAALPMKDAITFRQGLETRRIAVFADPMCGFCRQFEADLAALKDTTVHVFLVGMLSSTSTTIARDVWCARDPGGAWRQWMLQQVRPPKADADCDSKALERNLAFSRTHKISATPTSLFPGGARRAGALRPAELERGFTASVSPPARKP
jgi:thiol:disulfide interchange protein DsbC